MAAQTVIEQPTAVPRDQEDRLASGATAQNVVQPPPEVRETAQAPRAAQPRNGAATGVVGAIVLASVAVFAAGFLWERLAPAMRRLLLRAEEIRVPVALPLTIVEIARELYAERDSLPQATGHEHMR